MYTIFTYSVDEIQKDIRHSINDRLVVGGHADQIRQPQRRRRQGESP
jgi:hypothetical protein